MEDVVVQDFVDLFVADDGADGQSGLVFFIAAAISEVLRKHETLAWPLVCLAVGMSQE